MDDPLRQAEAQLQRYWNVDGLHEIAAGLIFGLTALWIWASDIAELPHAWKAAFSRSFPLLLCGGIWAAGAIVKAIRRRLTYPRVGFAELRRPSLKRRMAIGLLAAVIAAGVALFVTRDLSTALGRWAVPLLALVCAAFLWQLGWRAQTRRFYAIAAAVAAAGFAIAWADATFSLGMMLLWFAACAALLVSGGVTLWRFLHSAPPAEE